MRLHNTTQSERSESLPVGKDPRSKTFTLRVVVALLGGIYLLGGYGAIAAATSIPMISQLHPLFAFFSMGTNPGFGLIFLSVLAIGFVLLKWGPSLAMEGCWSFDSSVVVRGRYGWNYGV